jgi:hypothetical protein
MAMKRSNALSGSGGKGGGPGSRSLSNVTTYYGGRPSEKISPRGVSQFGSSIGNKATDSGGKNLRGGVEPVRGGAMGGMGSVPLGNTVAEQTICGVGGSRTVSRCGSQQGVSPATPIGPTKDTLAEFGADYQNAKTRG